MAAQSFQIAIDGPVAAGKGTISRLVADRLGFLYVDTGAMYRVTGMLADRAGVSIDDENALVELVEKVTIQMRNPSETEKDGRLTTVLVDDTDESWSIRTEKIGDLASKVATYQKVRAVLVAKQQEIAQSQNVVMEGRDITYRVLPDAQLKIYLTANEIVRAKRRQFQLQTRGMLAEFEEVYQELIERDKRDSQRTTDPLTILPEAWVIDSSDLSIDQVVDIIVGKAKMMYHRFQQTG
ncbi:MAG TPA: (d)CMP kinase [Candidatus Woesebacteria bacterium]|nr:(d)CMP kinase [Candidatus Woesebacteria bacterium]HNS65626.1 (d)CMP kinase [Candidatus Woesebacteria bacterium]